MLPQRFMNLFMEFPTSVLSRRDKLARPVLCSRMGQQASSLVPADVVLYGTSDELARLGKLTPGSCVVAVDDGTAVDSSLSAGCDVMLVDIETGVVGLEKILWRYFSDETIIAAGVNTFLEAMCADRGLDHLVDESFEVFGNPIFVNDLSYKVLAHTTRCDFRDREISDVLERGYVSEHLIEGMRREGISDSLAKTENVVRNTKYTDGSNWLFRSLSIRGARVAEIAMCDACKPFSRVDVELFDRFADLVCVELEKDDFYQDNRGVRVNYFLADVLDGAIDRDLLRERASRLGWRLDVTYFVLCISEMAGGSDEVESRRMGPALRDLIPDCHWTVRDGNLTALVIRDDESFPNDFTIRRLTGFLKFGNVCMGISDPFHDLADAPRHDRQASATMECGRMMRGTPGIFRHEDFASFVIARSIERDLGPDDSCPRTLRLVMEYDAAHNTSYTQTLHAYLFHPDDPAGAAAELSVHRNTLLYRMNKVREISGSDLSSGDERMRIALYLRLLEWRDATHGSTDER